MPGLQLSWNPHPHVALDLGFGTLGLFHRVTAGLRAFLLTHAMSPYLYLRGGVVVDLDGCVAGILSPGVGLEVSTRRGFNFFFETGADGSIAKRGGRSAPARLGAARGRRRLPLVDITRRYVNYAPPPLTRTGGCGDISSAVVPP
jgi:hypothetical protein